MKTLDINGAALLFIVGNLCWLSYLIGYLRGSRKKEAKHGPT